MAFAVDEVVSLSAYVASGSGTVRMGLYADSGGEPGALLGTTEAEGRERQHRWLGDVRVRLADPGQRRRTLDRGPRMRIWTNP